MNKSDILTGFNNHIIDFFSDVLVLFPNDLEIKTAHLSLIGIRKVNPKMIVTVWKNYISDKYKSEIEVGNLVFFINRNYNNDLQDLQDVQNASINLNKIDTLREPIKQMSDVNKQKIINYIQNLTKLCILYYS